MLTSGRADAAEALNPWELPWPEFWKPPWPVYPDAGGESEAGVGFGGGATGASAPLSGDSTTGSAGGLNSVVSEEMTPDSAGGRGTAASQFSRTSTHLLVRLFGVVARTSTGVMNHSMRTLPASLTVRLYVVTMLARLVPGLTGTFRIFTPSSGHGSSGRNVSQTTWDIAVKPKPPGGRLGLDVEGSYSTESPLLRPGWGDKAQAPTLSQRVCSWLDSGRGLGGVSYLGNRLAVMFTVIVSW